MIFIKNLSYIIILIIFLDIVLKFFGFGINSHWYDKNDKWYVTPYDMFSNKPNILDHNIQGFRGPSLSFDIPKEVYSIAFLGGSTGYRGNPPIPELLSLNLINMGINNIVYNLDISNLVSGVSKLSGIKFRNQKHKQAENLIKMFLAVAKDLRVIIIKFSDRLHNMKTLKHYIILSEIRRKRQNTTEKLIKIQNFKMVKNGITFHKIVL